MYFRSLRYHFHDMHAGHETTGAVCVLVCRRDGDKTIVCLLVPTESVLSVVPKGLASHPSFVSVVEMISR